MFLSLEMALRIEILRIKCLPNNLDTASYMTKQLLSSNVVYAHPSRRDTTPIESNYPTSAVESEDLLCVLHDG